MRARLALAAALMLAAPAVAQTVAITNARAVIGGADAPVEGATIVVQGGRIAAAGRGVAVPAGAQQVDAGGRWVTPGLIAGFSRLGIVEVDAVNETNDAAARQAEYSAALDVVDAFNPRSVNLPINRIEGLTRAIVAPGASHSVFNGQGAAIGLGGGAGVMRPRLFQFVELGERGAELSGGSRPAAFADFRNALREAAEYVAAPRARGGDRDSILNKADVEALLPVLRGEMPIVVHVERASDIERVLGLRGEFARLRIILVGASEGWMVADAIAAAKVPVIATGLNNLPSRFEMLAATQSNVGRMVRAGVKVALGMIDDDDSRQVRLLPQHAGNLVAMAKIPGAVGLTHAQALAAITRVPAEIFGLSDVGTLAVGKRADVVIWDGDPLELATAPAAVWIDGVPVLLTSRQTKLRDRYMPNRPTDRPEHYRR